MEKLGQPDVWVAVYLLVKWKLKLSTPFTWGFCETVFVAYVFGYTGIRASEIIITIMYIELRLSFYLCIALLKI